MRQTNGGSRAMRAWMDYATACSRMTLAANEVILRRVHRMATGAMTGPEATAMVMEKATAMAVSAERAAVAAARGSDALTIAASALRPYGTKTRSNVRKLRK
ncbi:MAG: hypothetical protein H0T41_06750 [Rhodobacteraceae bacterium]|nr:hypothetical protein [Paracoccaceae bacterium]